ncbi:unnamed protein product [Scytosiphon promiscuus]
MESEQQAFNTEVEGFYTGQYREAFSTPEELKDGVVQALSLWQRSNEAIPADAFEKLFDEALRECGDASRWSNYDPRVVFGYLPQPFEPANLAAIGRDLDQCFS